MSFIFPVNDTDDDACVSKLTEGEGKKRIRQYAYQEVQFEKASVDAVMFCKGVADVSVSKMF